MSNKPDWKDAPEWANWLAIDDDGVWCWFFNKPWMGNFVWFPHLPDNPSGDNFATALIDNNYHGNWKESLEPRP